MSVRARSSPSASSRACFAAVAPRELRTSTCRAARAFVFTFMLLLAACSDRAASAAGDQAEGSAARATSSAGASADAATAAPRDAHAGHGERKTHALWATRWDYATEDDVRTIVANAASAGFDTLFFQVRGNASAFYRSSFEPWAEELGGADPGFDPLAVAIEAAHSHGIELHAWVNVVPAWWGSTPPRDPSHVYHRHPEWLWYDQNGTRQPLQPRFYVSLNPCLPEVRYYIVGVLADLLARYDLDGLHMDYVRFPCEPPVIPSGSGLDYPRDARTVALYEAESGRAPDVDKAAWTKWRCDQLSKLVRSIRAMQREVRPSVVLSAAVGPDPEHHYAHYFQDARAWAAEGLVDVFVPMNYTQDNALFESRLEKWLGVAGVGGVRPIDALSRFDATTIGAAAGDTKPRNSMPLRSTSGHLASDDSMPVGAASEHEVAAEQRASTGAVRAVEAASDARVCSHRVVMGLQIHSLDHAADRKRFELALERCDGYSLFAYLTLFDSASRDAQETSETGRAKRTARRALWLPLLRDYAEIDAAASTPLSRLDAK